MFDQDSNPDEADLLRFIDQNRAEISYYLANENCERNDSNSIPALFVDMFRKAPKVYDVLRNMYLGSMLTSYLSYEPKDVNMDVELLLDTNFIVSLLDLNTEESTTICKTFIETSRSLGYSFTVLKDTIDEIQGLLNYKTHNLNQALIAKSINKEDIFNACDRRNLSCVDLERISDNIEETLREFGFRIILDTKKYKNKARVIKELDNNIQKYRNNFSITDKDVVNLSTRIAQRQISSVQEINDLAIQKGGTEFAERVKLEASKQEEIDKARAIKLDSLMKAMEEGIQEDIRQHKDKLDKNTMKDQLFNIYKKEQKRRADLWEAYQEGKFNRRKGTWILLFWLFISVAIILLIIALYLYSIYNVEFIDKLLDNKVISAAGSLVLVIFGGVVIKNYNNWCHNPEYEIKFKKKLSKPKEMQPISYEDFFIGK